MSHFTVLVVTDDQPTDQVLTETLQPWHEYECTGIKDQYVIFEPASDEDIAKYGVDNFDQHEGQCGHWTNPNKKWDWWQVGGRWSGHFIDINGNHVDIAQKHAIDFGRMRFKAAVDAMEQYRKVHTVIASRSVKPWSHFYETYTDIDEARTAFHKQSVIQDLRRTGDPDLTFVDIEDFLCPAHTYIERAEKKAAMTFAVVKDGVWHEKGRMGWFAMVSDSKGDDWAEEFYTLLESVTDEQWLTVVDCHI